MASKNTSHFDFWFCVLLILFRTANSLNVLSNTPNEYEGQTIDCSSENSTCVIIGNADSSFKDATIICPAESEVDCNITCIGINSCYEATIIAANSIGEVWINCVNNDTCSSISVTTNNALLVEIDCQASHSCDSSHFTFNQTQNVNLWCDTTNSCFKSNVAGYNSSVTVMSLSSNGLKDSKLIGLDKSNLNVYCMAESSCNNNMIFGNQTDETQKTNVIQLILDSDYSGNNTSEWLINKMGSAPNTAVYCDDHNDDSVASCNIICQSSNAGANMIFFTQNGFDDISFQFNNSTNKNCFNNSVSIHCDGNECEMVYDNESGNYICNDDNGDNVCQDSTLPTTTYFEEVSDSYSFSFDGISTIVSVDATLCIMLGFIIVGIVLSRIRNRRAALAAATANANGNDKEQAVQLKETKVRAIHSILYIGFFYWNANWLFSIFLFMLFPNVYVFQAFAIISWFVSAMHTFAVGFRDYQFLCFRKCCYDTRTVDLTEAKHIEGGLRGKHHFCSTPRELVIGVAPNNENERVVLRWNKCGHCWNVYTTVNVYLYVIGGWVLTLILCGLLILWKQSDGTYDSDIGTLIFYLFVLLALTGFSSFIFSRLIFWTGIVSVSVWLLFNRYGETWGLYNPDNVSEYTSADSSIFILFWSAFISVLTVTVFVFALSHNWQMKQVTGIVVSALLGLFDYATDINIALVWFAVGHTWWAIFQLVFVFGGQLFSAAFLRTDMQMMGAGMRRTLQSRSTGIGSVASKTASPRLDSPNNNNMNPPPAMEMAPTVSNDENEKEKYKKENEDEDEEENSRNILENVDSARKSGKKRVTEAVEKHLQTVDKVADSLWLERIFVASGFGRLFLAIQSWTNMNKFDEFRILKVWEMIFETFPCVGLQIYQAMLGNEYTFSVVVSLIFSLVSITYTAVGVIFYDRKELEEWKRTEMEKKLDKETNEYYNINNDSNNQKHFKGQSSLFHKPLSLSAAVQRIEASPLEAINNAPDLPDLFTLKTILDENEETGNNSTNHMKTQSRQLDIKTDDNNNKVRKNKINWDGVIYYLGIYFFILSDFFTRMMTFLMLAVIFDGLLRVVVVSSAAIIVAIFEYYMLGKMLKFEFNSVSTKLKYFLTGLYTSSFYLLGTFGLDYLPTMIRFKPFVKNVLIRLVLSCIIGVFFISYRIYKDEYEFKFRQGIFPISVIINIICFFYIRSKVKL